MRKSKGEGEAVGEGQSKGRQGRLFGGSRKQRLNDEEDEGGDYDGGPQMMAPSIAADPSAKKTGASRLSSMMPTRHRKASNAGGPARMDSFPMPGAGHPSGGPIPTIHGGPMPTVTNTLPGAYGAHAEPGNPGGMAAAAEAARERERQEQEELELAMAMSMSIADEARRNSREDNAVPQPPSDPSHEDADLRRALELSAREAAPPPPPAAPNHATAPNLVDFSEPAATQQAAPVAAVDPFAPPTAPAAPQYGGSALESLVGMPPSHASGGMAMAQGMAQQAAPAPYQENPFAPSAPAAQQQPAAVSTFGNSGFDGYCMNYTSHASQPPGYVQPGAVIGQPVLPSVTGWAAQQQQAMHAQQLPMQAMHGQQLYGTAGMAPPQQYATGARAPRVAGATGASAAAAADPFSGLMQQPPGGSSVL